MATRKEFYMKFWANLKTPEPLDLDLYKIIYIFLGFWPSDNKRRRFGSVWGCFEMLEVLFRKFLPLYLQFMTLYACFIGKPMLVCTCFIDNDLSGTLNAIASIAIDVPLLASYKCLLYRQQQIERMFSAMEKMRERSSKLFEHPLEIQERNKLWSKWPLVYLGGCYAFLVISYFDLSKLYNNGEFVYFQWYPFDETAPHNYPFVFVLTIVCHTFTLICVVTFISMFMSLIVEAIGHLRLLSYNLRHIVNVKKMPAVTPLTTGTQNVCKSAEENDRKETTFVHQGRILIQCDPKVSNSLPIDRGDGKESATAENLLDATVVDTMMGSQCKISNRLIIKRGGDLNEALQTCVQLHYAIKRFIEEVTRTYNSFMFALLLFTFIPSSLAIVLIIYTEELDTRAMTLIILVVGSNIAAAACCWLTNELTEESEAVRDAVYDCDWFDQSESFKRSMRIIMSQSNQPVVVRVGGFISMSMETYYAMTKVTYTYVMAIWTQYQDAAKRKPDFD